MKIETRKKVKEMEMQDTLLVVVVEVVVLVVVVVDQQDRAWPGSGSIT